MKYIEEARRRYPVGTRFTPAHINNPSTIYTIVDIDEKRSDESLIIGIVLEQESFSPCVFAKEKWADIITINYEIY